MDTLSCQLLNADLQRWVELFLVISFLTAYTIHAVSYFMTANQLRKAGSGHIDRAATLLYFIGFAVSCYFVIKILFVFINTNRMNSEDLLLQLIVIPAFLLLFMLYTAWNKSISLYLRYLIILGYAVLFIPIFSLGSIFFFEQIFYKRRVCFGITCPVNCSQLDGLQY